jgi:hypothetical protein
MIGFRQNIRILVYDRDGNVLEDREIQNELKNAGLDLIALALRTALTDCEIKYLAWGSGATANDPAQTTLVAEFGRKAITSQEDGGTGITTTTTYISPSEANSDTIEEMGWFAGAAASATKDSGVLMARVLYSRAKTDMESVQVVRTDTIAEVFS